MKKMIVLMMILLFTIPVRADFDYSQLDEMTVDELKELEKEISKRITDAEAQVIDGVWSVKYFIDEFKQPTDEKYITADFSGTFSNMAVDNKALTVRFIVTPDYVGLQFYEYGNQLAKNIYSDTQVNTVHTLGDVTPKKTYHFETPGKSARAKAVKDSKVHISGDHYMDMNGSYEEFIELMLTNHSIKFVTNGCSSETYNWEIPDMDNFAELYNDLIGE